MDKPGYDFWWVVEGKTLVSRALIPVMNGKFRIEERVFGTSPELTPGMIRDAEEAIKERRAVILPFLTEASREQFAGSVTP